MDLSGFYGQGFTDTTLALNKQKQTDRALDIDEGRLDLEGRNIRFNEKKTQRDQIMKLVSDAITNTKTTLETAVGSGRTTRDSHLVQSGISALRNQVMGTLEQSAQAGVVGPEVLQMAMSQIDAIPMTLMSPEEKGMAEGAQANASFNAQTDGVVARKKAEIAAGVAADPNKSDPNFVNFVDPKTSDFRSVDLSTPEGMQAATELAGSGYVKVGANIQGSTSDVLGVQKTEVADFRDAEIAVRQANQTIDRMVDQLNDQETVTGALSAGIRGIEGLVGNIKQAGKLFGAEDGDGIFAEDGQVQVAGFNFDAFGDSAPKSAAFKTNALNLAYALARADEPGGRLSKEDVQHKLNEIAANSGDKRQIFATLAEVKDRNIRNLRIRHEVLNRSGELGEFPSFETSKPDREVIKFDKNGNMIQ